jgi:L1 cell adhesion molecule like protein
LKSSLDEEQIKSKLSEDEIKSINSTLDESLSWLDSNQLAETEEFKDKLQYLEKLVNPIMSRMHQGAQQTGQGPQQAGQSCGQQSQQFGQNKQGPTIEEMD